MLLIVQSDEIGRIQGGMAAVDEWMEQPWIFIRWNTTQL